MQKRGRAGIHVLANCNRGRTVSCLPRCAPDQTRAETHRIPLGRICASRLIASACRRPRVTLFSQRHTSMRRRTTTAVAIVAALAIIAVTSDQVLAQHRGGPPRVRGPVFIGGYFYDPFFGPYPWWGPGTYGYPYFPVYDDRA